MITEYMLNLGNVEHIHNYSYKTYKKCTNVRL